MKLSRGKHKREPGLILIYQSQEGHTELTDLTDAEVRAKFDELVALGLTGFADTRLDLPVNVRSVDEALEMGAREIFFPGRLKAG